MDYALKSKEVLVKWRGKIPIKFLDIMDPTTGELGGTMADVLASGRDAILETFDAAKSKIVDELTENAGSQPSPPRPQEYSSQASSSTAVYCPPGKATIPVSYPSPRGAPKAYEPPSCVPPKKKSAYAKKSPAYAAGAKAAKRTASCSDARPLMPERPAPRGEQQPTQTSASQSAQNDSAPSQEMPPPPTVPRRKTVPELINAFVPMKKLPNQSSTPPPSLSMMAVTSKEKKLGPPPGLELEPYSSPLASREHEGGADWDEDEKNDDSEDYPGGSQPRIDDMSKTMQEPERRCALTEKNKEAVREFVDTRFEKKNEEELKDQGLWAKRDILQNVWALERIYYKKVTILTQQEVNGVSQAYQHINLCEKKGWDPRLRAQKWQLMEEIRGDPFFAAMVEKKDNLLYEHGKALMDIEADSIIEDLPLWELSARALKEVRVRDQVDIRLPAELDPSWHPCYKDLLHDGGWIWAHGCPGRKPRKDVWEKPAQPWEMHKGYCFGQWWMDLGKFRVLRTVLYLVVVAVVVVLYLVL